MQKTVRVHTSVYFLLVFSVDMDLEVHADLEANLAAKQNNEDSEPPGSEYKPNGKGRPSNSEPVGSECISAETAQEMKTQVLNPQQPKQPITRQHDQQRGKPLTENHF